MHGPGLAGARLHRFADQRFLPNVSDETGEDVLGSLRASFRPTRQRVALVGFPLFMAQPDPAKAIRRAVPAFTLPPQQ